ncbi:DNA methyltransferase [Pantoea ananatis]|uniref:DNA adenine methylase n=1 Tax=Pantoea ananas TaxID=553 RepID=UPI000D72D260|nr:DNA adenine methylase [Pantoea ananatis]AWQ20154.1 DNA methyltransferase [Pantoea ananatis]
MPVTYSPLRYPGGKTAIYPMMSSIIQNNSLKGCKYAEPYAGGGGLALALLFGGFANEIHLNDLDRSIWSTWFSVLNDTEAFIDKIKNTEVTIGEWHKQRDIQNNKLSADVLELGFSTFFLNRTNRSGIILKAGVIGGLKQEGDYKLNCRFNKDDLIKKILKIKENKDLIKIYNEDAINFITKIDKNNKNDVFMYIDPPYFEKGASLYTNFYNEDDHTSLSKVISSIKMPWVLTYDNAEKIKKLYSKKEMFEFSLNYSAAKKRVGTELLITCDGLNIPPELMGGKLIKVS